MARAIPDDIQSKLTVIKTAFDELYNVLDTYYVDADETAERTSIEELQDQVGRFIDDKIVQLEIDIQAHFDQESWDSDEDEDD